MCPCRKEKYRRTNKPKDRYKPEENKRRKGPLLPLIQRGFAELNADTRYQGDDEPSEGPSSTALMVCTSLCGSGW